MRRIKVNREPRSTLWMQNSCYWRVGRDVQWRAICSDSRRSWVGIYPCQNSTSQEQRVGEFFKHKRKAIQFISSTQVTWFKNFPFISFLFYQTETLTFKLMRWIIVLVYTKPVNSQRVDGKKRRSRKGILSGQNSAGKEITLAREWISGGYPELEQPIRARKKTLSLVIVSLLTAV